MNPEEEESHYYPATVFADRACTREVTDMDKIGWMKCGERINVVIKLDNLWVPYALSHHMQRVHFSALRTAA